MTKNIAFGKPILETDIWDNHSVITDGNYLHYNKQSEYAAANFPCYCTVDLQKTQSLKRIRFLLWDNDSRSYKYRLLTSTDLRSWSVHYDTPVGTKGWQVFDFDSPTEIRYIRIHGLYNTQNNGIHIVEIEAYKELFQIDTSQQNIYLIRNEEIVKEISDGKPISNQLSLIVNKIKKLPELHQGLDKSYFDNIASDLETRIYDVEKIEKGMEAIRRQIIEPVNNELSKSNNIGKWSISLGLIGGIIGIISIILGLIGII